MAELAEALRGEGPLPLLQQPLQGHGIDHLSVLPGRGILAGLCRQEVITYYPSYGPLVLFDGQGRQELWRGSGRPPSPSRSSLGRRP